MYDLELEASENGVWISAGIRGSERQTVFVTWNEFARVRAAMRRTTLLNRVAAKDGGHSEAV